MNLTIATREMPATSIASQTGNDVLVCKDVSARYGRIEVCRSIDLRVAAGEAVAILGPNGAGKSSFLGAMAGLVEGGGVVELDGQDLSALPTHIRAQRGLALVPEIRGNICAALTVEENLALGLRIVQSDRKAALARIFDLFPILRERLQAAAGMLSGGEQQMLAIGMAAARRPRVLLLDEPTQGLAPSVHDLLRDTIALLRADGLAIIVAEQNVPFAASVVDRFVMLVDGRIVASGEPDELRKHDDILSNFLG
jgi:branched-chain amino acid transport system ATP-binding protein